MLNLSRTTRVFLATKPVDMRKGFDGLFALVENVIREDPFSGHLFVFRNQRRDRLKVLWWDRDGLAIFYKRLERGSYQFPTDGSAASVGAASVGAASVGAASVGAASVGAASAGPSKPSNTIGSSLRCEIRADELALLLDGIDLGSVKRRKRYQRPESNTAQTVVATSS
jgi:transposase